MISQKDKPLVSVKCLVFNHEPYIRQCLDGFIAQKTTFSFEVIVHDDASTDKSADIIREYAELYPNIIKPIFEKENQYSRSDGALRKIIIGAFAASSKYIAICEGDDYWIDPLKLQKQVDFLEANQDYGMVVAKSNSYIQENDTFGDVLGNDDVEDYSKLMMSNFDISAPTCLIRKSLYLECYKNYKWFCDNNYMVDTLLAYHTAYYSRIKFMNDVVSVYRVLPESACHSTNIERSASFLMRYLIIKNAFLLNHPVEPEYQDRVNYHIKNELIKVGQYYKYVGESVVRSSKSYKLGKLISKLLFFKR